MGGWWAFIHRRHPPRNPSLRERAPVLPAILHEQSRGSPGFPDAPAGKTVHSAWRKFCLPRLYAGLTSMTKPSLATAAWITLAAGTFALGWILKPDPDDARSGDPGNSVLSAISQTSSSSRASGHHSATTATTPPLSTAGNSTAPAELTKAGITALGEELRTARDPLARREAFAKLLAGLTVDNALEIRAQIDHLTADTPEFRDFHFAWGKIAGQDAVIHGARGCGRASRPSSR